MRNTAKRHFKFCAVNEIEKRYYTIGEVAEMLGVKPSVIRFWEQEFEQLKTQKTTGGRRVYTSKEVALLRKIHYLLKDLKYTVKGAREKLDADRKPKDEKAQLRETLQETKVFLESLLEAL
jgi:DNA-binding transcriptional MerR regulator